MSYRSIVRPRTHPVSLHLPCNLIVRVSLPLIKYMKALYLFTFSDLRTTVFPAVCLRLYRNPPHIDLSIGHICLFLSPRYDCRLYAVLTVMDVVAHPSIQRRESESEPRGGSVE